MSFYSLRLPLIYKLNLSKLNIFNLLTFLYFFSLHADQLGIQLIGFNIRINNLIASLIFLLVTYKKLRNTFSINKKIFYCLILLSVFLVISSLNSIDQKRCFLYVAMYAMTVLLYFLLPYFLIQFRNYKTILKIYLSSFVICGLYAFVQFAVSLIGLKDPFARQQAGFFYRPNAFAYEPSYYALYMTPFVFLVNSLFLMDQKHEYPLIGKIKAWYVLLINFLFLISTSTGAFLAYLIFIVLVIFYFFTKHQKLFNKKMVYKGIAFFSAAFFVLSILFSEFIKNYFFKIFYTGFSHHSFYERWIGIVNCWKVFLEHPFFGVGIGGIGKYLYEQYLMGDPNLYVLYNDIRLFDAYSGFKVFEPMNAFTEVLAGVGIVGLLGFLALFFHYFNITKKLMRSLICVEEKKLIFAFFLSVIVMLFVLQSSQGIYRTYVWVHFAIAFSYAQRLINANSEKFSHSIRLDQHG